LRVSPAGIQDCVSRDIPTPGNPVSTGSIAISEWCVRTLSSRYGRLGKQLRQSQSFLSALESLRPKKRSVNTKPAQKYFVKFAGGWTDSRNPAVNL